jgi:hypothetical protein
MTSLGTELTAPLPLDRRDKLIAVILGLVVLAAGYWWMVGGVCGIYHDDAIYVTTAKALASGQGYRLIDLPGAPIQTKYPFLYPALLALIWKIWPSFPNNLLAMQSLSLLAGAAVAGLSYLYLVRFGYFARSVALAAGLLCATSMNFLYFATLTLSEIPFALLLLGALWALEEQVRASRSSKIRQFFLGVLLALPFMCRTIGISLVPVGLFVLYRHKLPLRWVAAAATAIVCSWFFWTLAVSIYFPQDQITGYYTNYLTWWLDNGFSFFARVLFNNLITSMVMSGYLGFPWLHQAFFSLKFVPYIFYSILGIMIWIMLVKHAQKYQILPLYLISYAFIMIVWPWPPFRFLVPILPFLLAYLCSGAIAIKQRLTFLPSSRPALMVGVGILLAANLALVFIRGQANQETRYPLLIPQHPSVSWSSYESVFNWVNLHTSPDDLIASGLDTMIYLYTGRRGFRPFVGCPALMFYGDASQCLGTPEKLLQVMKAYQARFLVLTPMPGFGEEKPFAALLKELLQRHPGLLQPVYVGEDPRFVIFTVKSGPK